MPHLDFDLSAAAHQEMLDHGFTPDFPPEVVAQVKEVEAHPVPATARGDIRDLRNLLWSSIDNDTSRDLDQIEVAERVGNAIRVRVGVADVDSKVAINSPIDRFAGFETTSVYTGIRTFPMLPEQLSTDLTSLNENADRAAMVVEFVVAADGTLSSPSIYRGLVRNKAQLAYNAVGAWLEGTGEAPAKV